MTLDERIEQEAVTLLNETLAIMAKVEPEDVAEADTPEDREKALEQMFRPLARKAVERQAAAARGALSEFFDPMFTDIERVLHVLGFVDLENKDNERV